MLRFRVLQGLVLSVSGFRLGCREGSGKRDHQNWLRVQGFRVERGLGSWVEDLGVEDLRLLVFGNGPKWLWGLP